MIVAIFVLILLAALAAANGANDVSKGVATLVGSGVARYRAAILWGAVATLAGILMSGVLAKRMVGLFANGIFSAKPTPAFVIAVICGSLGWVAAATVMRLPVSTTHAIIGSLIGAGLIYDPASVEWGVLLPKLVAPLLLSIAISYLLSAGLNRVFRRSAETSADCICISAEALDTGVTVLPQVTVSSGTTEECATKRSFIRLNTETLHWLSSGTVGFARGLNDGPKLAAIGLLATGGEAGFPLLSLVALTMFVGSLWAGRRVARVLAEDVLRMNHHEGFLANLSTALLVGVGANLGLPMSTTQIAGGAIAGIAGGSAQRLSKHTVRDLALAWTLTPAVAGLIAAVIFLIVSRIS